MGFKRFDSLGFHALLTMHGFEEAVEEHGEIVKKNRKFNDKILMEYVKANNPKYQKETLEDEMPPIQIKRF